MTGGGQALPPAGGGCRGLAVTSGGVCPNPENFITRFFQIAPKNCVALPQKRKGSCGLIFCTLPVHFCRQKVIGAYIVDFYCAEYALVIELDGAQHYEGEAEAYDKRRDAYLASLGLTVLRYSNLDFHRNYKNICADILSHIGLE